MLRGEIQNLGRLHPQDLSTGCPQNHFLDLHRPLRGRIKQQTPPHQMSLYLGPNSQTGHFICYRHRKLHLLTTQRGFRLDVKLPSAIESARPYTLEKQCVTTRIRIPANKNLEREIVELLTRPVGHPGHKLVAESDGRSGRWQQGSPPCRYRLGRRRKWAQRNQTTRR